jgi:hypothetical protein
MIYEKTNRLFILLIKSEINQIYLDRIVNNGDNNNCYI